MMPSTWKYAKFFGFFVGLILIGRISQPAEGQTDRATPPDRIWDADYGGGQLTDPGHSRRLPPADPADDRPHSVPATNPVPKDPSASASGEAAPRMEWWREAAESTVGSPDQSLQSRTVSPRGELVLSSQILAMVGSQPILAGELLGRVNELLAPYLKQLPEDQLEEQRWLLMQKMLPSAIEAKLVYLDFLRKIPPEQVKVIRSNVYEQFDKEQLPRMVEQAKLDSTADLDAKMRSLGSSLDETRRSFFEQVAAREMIRQQTDGDREATHDELLAYYREHRTEYEFQAQAIWEELMVRFSEFDSKGEAFGAIAKMGNAVLGGAPFDVVARRDSHGPTSHEGGRYDWTTEGSLVSTVIDEAIFTLPIGKLSRILEDEKGFHIVRVVDRKEAGCMPFQKTQREIREKIKEQDRDAKVKEYLARIKRETYVWNYFDEEGAQQIARESSDTPR